MGHTGRSEFKVDHIHKQSMEESRICVTCGTQFPPSNARKICEICMDDRQYVPEGGQSWTTHETLLKNNSVRILKINDRTYEFEIIPRFAIGQRAFLILSEHGNVLWDCIPLLNTPTIDFINSKGGLKTIAFSHPHYYSNMNDWAEQFHCPVYLHQSDEEWAMHTGDHLSPWKGDELALWDGMKVINIGGHFSGSSILHVPSLSEKGTVFVGDTVYVSPSKKHMAVMHSYPNRIPLPVAEVRVVKERFEKVSFDKLYGFYSYQNVIADAKKILTESLNRYLA